MTASILLAERPSTRKQQQTWALPVLLAGTVMIVLDFFIVNVALPAIQNHLHAGPSALDWVVIGYGLLVAYLPLQDLPARGSVRAQPYVVPSSELAVSVHVGPFSEIDRTYGQLGLHVAAAAIGVEGPIREHYLVTVRDTPEESRHRIEVAWPIFQTVVPA